MFKNLLIMCVFLLAVRCEAIIVDATDVSNMKDVAHDLIAINKDAGVDALVEIVLQVAWNVSDLPSGTEELNITPTRYNASVSTAADHRSILLRLIHENNFWVITRGQGPNDTWSKTKVLTKRDAALLHPDPIALEAAGNAVDSRKAGKSLIRTRLDY